MRMTKIYYLNDGINFLVTLSSHRAFILFDKITELKGEEMN